MSQLKCLIIEDEPLAAEGLESFIKQVPFLELIAICGDAMTALDYLIDHQMDNTS